MKNLARKLILVMSLSILSIIQPIYSASYSPFITVLQIPSSSELIIKFKDQNENSLGIPPIRLRQINNVINKLGLQATFQSDQFSGFKLLAIRNRKGALTTDKLEKTAIQLKRSLPYIESVQPNYVRRTTRS